MRPTVRYVLTAALAIVSAGCGGKGGHGDARSSAAQAIRELVNQTVAAAGRRDMNTYLRYYAPNAALVLPGLPIQYGLALPRQSGFAEGYKIAMETVKVEVSDDADLGYAFGTYRQTAPDPKTHVLMDTAGKWMSVFKKQPDGSWGAVADTFNVDP